MPKKGYKQTKKHREKISNKIPWNKGLTKETDERVRRNSEATSNGRKGIKLSIDTKKKISKKVKISHRDGKRIECYKKISITNQGHFVSEETKEKLRQYTGKRAANWRGGISKKPYSFKFTNKLKEEIRKRDYYTCQLCNKEQKEMIGYHKKLIIHHIDYNKQNCKKTNLITLCKACNSFVNFNRKVWIKHFNNLIKAKKL